MIPNTVSKKARSLIKSLLEKDKTKRLGSVSDYDEIKSHSYFSGINWDEVKTKKHPAPLHSYLKSNDLVPKQKEQYKKLIKNYGYDKNIQNIISHEYLDDPSKGSYIKEWIDS